MALAERFDPGAGDLGFVRSYDLESARRQLQVSLLLVLTLACAALALVATAGFGAAPRGDLSAAPQPAIARLAQS
ncbi:hypothetical protein [Methylocella sp.]|uniref:hypothetical protein n=1 Tax=Methylocella sp. TaxID=1978226 RepID=UPI00378317D9